MARSKKLADAYLELRAEDSKLTGDVKVKATKAAKAFGAQLNNALKALSLDPIDVKADPKTALAAIETTRQRLRGMSRDAESVEVRVRTERALTQLDRFAKQLGAVDDTPVEPKVELSPAQRQIDQLQRRLTALGVDPPVTLDADPDAALAAIGKVDERLREVSRTASNVQVRMDVESARADIDRLRQRITALGDESAEGFSARFAARLGPLIGSLPLSGPMVAAVAAGAAIAAPTLAGVIGAAMIGGGAGLGIVGGAAVAVRDQRVKNAGADLGQFILGDLEQRAADFVPVVLDGIDDIRAGWISLGPDISRIFASSRLVDPLVAGAVSGARRLIGGIADAVEEADPVVDAFGASLDRLGDSIGDQFTLLAGDADQAASAVEDLTTSIDNMIRVVGGLVHVGLVVKGWTDQLDVAIDKGRYWIEDNSYLAKSLRDVGVELDLTADGFKKGTAEAEAMRRASIGTADAADFATLKAAGMTDAQIAAADASGTYRIQLDAARAATERAAGQYASTSQSVEEFTRRLDEMNRTLGATYSGNLSVEESNIRLEESIDRATEAAKKNGDGISANIPKQRANREALVGIANAALAAAEDIFAQTKSQELASAATERGRAAFLKTADQMGVNAREARNLANQLFGIPRDVSTKADFQPDNAGVAAWKKTLSGIDRRIFIKAEFDLINNSDVALALRLGRLEDGGPVEGDGPKGKDSTLIYAAPGEHMLTAAEVDRMGGHGAVYAFRRQLMAVGRAAAPTQAGIPGYAGGGAIGASVERAVMPGWMPPRWDGLQQPVVSMEPVVAELRQLRRDTAALTKAVERVAPGVGRALTGATEDALTEARLRGPAWRR